MTLLTKSALGIIGGNTTNGIGIRKSIKNAWV